MRIHIPFIKRKNKDNNNPLKYQSWDEISIKQYDDILNISYDKDLTQFEKNVKLLSIVWDKKEDEILNENIEDIRKANEYTAFLSNFNFNKDNKPKKIIINNMECSINYNLKDMTYAQFVDFQTYYQMGMAKHMHNLLSTLIIPNGKKYGEGYNIDEFTEHLYNEMPITIAQSVLFFFAKMSIRLYSNTRTYLISQMKKMLKKEKNEEIRNKIQEALTLLYGSTV